MLPPREKTGKAKPRAATIMTAQLSADRRVLDEATAGQFLQIFQRYLSDPKQLLL
jgi:pyruvate/2-oxoglutarate dehydrogenase complex dihydrolipoamide acyltransferase (E2) component